MPGIISNWISDYGTADIYRTKETEFFGTPWEPAARDRMIRQSPLTYAGRVKTPTLCVPRRGRPARAVRGSRADAFRAQTARVTMMSRQARGPMPRSG